MAQLSFDLLPAEPLLPEYFVPHSGVGEALAVFEQCLGDLSLGVFRFVFLYGPQGSGKSHLIRTILARVPEGVEVEHITDLSVSSRVVARFEEMRSQGGLMIVEARELPEDPHLSSRLLSGYIVKVRYPQEEELRPLLVSLAERRNLRLSDYNIEYLLRLLPLNLLSFESILAAIDQISLAQSRKIGSGLIREVLAGSGKRGGRFEHHG